MVLALPYHMMAQSEIDALRYSFTTHGGTARYQSMSGAFGALGADFSSLSTNPAGIGTFKKGRIMFSPVFMMKTVDSDYKGKTTADENVFVNVNNFGVVINLKPYEESSTAWNNFAFAAGYNKLKNFNNDITIKGFNDVSSMLDQFMLNSDGILAENLPDPEYLAYDTYLTDYWDNPNNTELLYTHPYYNNYSVNQTNKITTTGGIGEYVFSLGGNYSNKFQIGMTFGIQNARYKETNVFSETSDSTDLASFDFTSNLETKGTGYNFKLGMIYLPSNALRFGIAFHTPTFFKLNDVYSYEISSRFRTPDVYGNDTYFSKSQGVYESKYEIYTPWKFIASMAVVIGQYGLISADYDFINYGNARMRSEEYDYTDINNNIKEIYRTTQNLRIGGEVRIAPVYLRGGVSYYGSPTSKEIDAIGSIKGYSLGIGLKTENIFVDLAFSHTFNDIEYRLYDYELGQEKTNLHLNEDLIVMTIGYKF